MSREVNVKSNETNHFISFRRQGEVNRQETASRVISGLNLIQDLSILRDESERHAGVTISTRGAFAVHLLVDCLKDAVDSLVVDRGKTDEASRWCIPDGLDESSHK
ncbi:MAG: hypothetical protein AAF541_10535 [Pseudomonadota bacterium]